jgi:hypothetical protein
VALATTAKTPLGHRPLKQKRRLFTVTDWRSYLKENHNGMRRQELFSDFAQHAHRECADFEF